MYQPNKQRQHISAGNFRRVWHKPNFGLLRPNKWLPTAFAPLTTELTMQDGAQWCDTSSRTVTSDTGDHAVANSTLYELRNMYLYYDIVTLDSLLPSPFANMLKSGGAMNLSMRAR